ncbi:MAG: hypothetical protein ACRDWI_11700 [Jiangellaceae bacterium]
MAEEELPPDMRNNLLKDRRQEAVTRAEEALGNLRADTGNPLATPLEALHNGAWESPSSERTTFIDTLDGAGGAVKQTFSSAVDELSGAAASEPEQVDVNDETVAWKASSGAIDARMGWVGY